MINNLFYGFLIGMLIIITYIDIKKMIIPNFLLIIMFVCCLTYFGFTNNINKENIIGGIIGFSFFLLLAYITNALGGGDIKLIAVLGVIFGINGILFIMLFSFIFGAIVSVILLLFKTKRKTDNIAFAPFISLATITYMLFGNYIIQFYINKII